MDDKTIMTDILNSVKGSCDLLLHGSVEAATPTVHTTFKNGLIDSLQMQNDIYNIMSKKGWYPEQKAEQQKIDQAKQKFMQG